MIKGSILDYIQDTAENEIYIANILKIEIEPL